MQTLVHIRLLNAYDFFAPTVRASSSQPTAKRLQDIPHALFHLQLGNGIQWVPEAIDDFILWPGRRQVADRRFEYMMLGLAVID